MFEIQSFMPHGHCYLWRGDILWTHLISDLVIGISYFAIPLFLMRFLKKRPEMPFRGMVTLFILFIVSCGVTHFFAIWTIWNPWYGVEGILKAITALVSLVTALMMIKVYPLLIKAPTPDQIEQTLKENFQLKLKEESQQIIYEERNKLKRITESIHLGIFEYDIENQKFWVSDSFILILSLESLGSEFDLEELKQKIDNELIGRFVDEVEKTKQIYHLQQSNTFEMRLNSKTLEFSMAQKSDGYITGSIADVSDRVQSNQLIQSQKESLQQIYDHTQTGIFIIEVDAHGEFHISVINHIIQSFLPIKIPESGPLPLKDLIDTYFDEEVVRQLEENYQTCVDKNSVHSYEEYITYEGESHWWLTHLYPVENDEGRIYRIIGSSSIITSQKKTQDELDKSSKYLETILDSSMSGTYIYDAQAGNNIYINKRYTEITGYTMEDLAEITQMERLFHPEEYGMIYEHIAQVSQSKKPIKIKYRFRHKQGHWIWCYSIDLNYMSEEGVMRQMMGSFVEISDFVKTTQKLTQSNSELERFAYAASHDLQEPLRKILTFSNMLEENIESQADEEAQFFIERIQDASMRMSDMIQGILNLSKLADSELEKGHYSLETIVDKSKSLIYNLISESDAEIIINHKEITVYCEFQLMIMVFQNILTNSIKYTKENEKPLIEVSVDDGDSFYLISIMDHGRGFNPDDALEIFKPFKRLVNKSEVPGSGIGLALCNRIIERLGGSIYAESAPGQGTTIFIKVLKGNT